MLSTQNMEVLRILGGSTFEEEHEGFDLVALEQTDTHSRIRGIYIGFYGKCR